MDPNAPNTGRPGITHELPPQNIPALLKHFESPQALDTAIQHTLAQDGNEPLIGSICVAVGVDIRTLQRYLKGEVNGITEEWATPLKRAWREVARGYERTLRGQKAVGSIFALKQMGWSDESTVHLPDVANLADSIRSGFGELLDEVRSAKAQPIPTHQITNETKQIEGKGAR